MSRVRGRFHYLASVQRIEPATVEAVAEEALRQGRVIGVRLDPTEEDEATPWDRPPSGRPRPLRVTEPLPSEVRAILAQRLFVETAGLPSSLLNAIKRLAAFQNPELYKKQGLRLSTVGTSRVIACAEEHPQHLALPRGCEHDAIVPRTLWDHAHKILAENYAVRANRTRAKTPALLKGIIRCAHCGSAMGPTFTRKGGKTYRYYLCVHASKNGYGSCPVKTVPAGEIEDRLRVLQEMRTRWTCSGRNGKRDPGASTGNLGKIHSDLADTKKRFDEVNSAIHALEDQGLTERDVIEALERLDPAWEELFPAEQARIVRLLVERVEVHPEGISLGLRSDGLRSLVTELGAGAESVAEGALA